MSAAEKKQEEVPSIPAAPPVAPVRSLVTKLAEVMGEVERIAKNGRNINHNYDYATEADITAAVREHMSKRHLMLMPNVEKTEWETLGATKSGAPRKLCTLTVKFTLVDGDSGEERSFIILGQGEDTGDKATYKAMTGALKYALLKLFMIPTGDDPENDSEHRYTPGQENKPTPAERASNSPPPSDSPAVPFGKMKGKRLCEIPDADVEYHLKAATKAVALNDPTWGEKNKAWLAACQAEASRRVFPAGTGKKEAPKNVSAKRAAPGLDIIDMEPGETEAQALARTKLNAWQRIVELGALYGMTETQVAEFCRPRFSGRARSSLTAADVQAVQQALGDMKK